MKKTMKMKRKSSFISFVLFFIMAILLADTSFAQLSKEDKLDSLKADFVKDSSRIFRKREVGLLLALDGRSSFIRKKPIDVQGLQIGLTGGRTSFGVGFYKALQGYQTASQTDGDVTTIDSTSVGFFNLFYEHAFVLRKWWEIGLLMEFGGGGQTSYHQVANKSVRVIMRDKSTFLHGAVGVDINFNLFYWLSLNVMAGYRLATGQAQFNFNGPYFSYGLAPHLGELIRRFKFHERRGAYMHNVSMIEEPYIPSK